MSAQDRAPAYAISLLAGILTFIGGLAKASTSGIIKYTASGATFNNFVGNSVRSTNFGLAVSSAKISAVILILSGILVLVSAVVMSFRSHQYSLWGTIILVFSVVGLFAGGNFLTGVGSVLGILGGLLAIVYRTASRHVPA
ncbi:hypothetical protein E6H31_03855 [Candidatus Bathyarchaeota archaeon]|nr:MAG: hypothetical protein E6H31_03855 [Candidatus Bathyarchaeota archaeon]